MTELPAPVGEAIAAVMRELMAIDDPRQRIDVTHAAVARVEMVAGTVIRLARNDDQKEPA